MDAKQHASLPVPDAEALARSTTLLARIAAEIVSGGGWIPFSRYMERALYTPGLGYYSSSAVKFGRTPADGSDFITAPEISPYFGRTLVQPIAEALAMADADEIMEFGAGTGKLAAQILNGLEALDADQPVDAISKARRPGNVVKRCRQYTIVELSGDLRDRQRTTLEERAPALLQRVRWIDKLPERFHGVIIGNEVLDAMPIQLYPCINGQWFERGVGTEGTRLALQDRRVTTPEGLPDIPAALRTAIESAPVDYLVETHVAARAFVGTVCRMLERGAAFFIDYGFPEHEYYHPQRASGTLMCHYRHQAHGDPLLYPGLQDITAHVDFSGLAQAALDAGADILGYVSQARFLINAGIADHLSQSVSPGDPARYLPAASGVQQLLSESEMGELFKVIGFSRGLDDVPQAFVAGDRSWTLFREDDSEQDPANGPVGDMDNPDSAGSTGSTGSGSGSGSGSGISG